MSTKRFLDLLRGVRVPPDITQSGDLLLTRLLDKVPPLMIDSTLVTVIIAGRTLSEDRDLYSV